MTPEYLIDCPKCGSPAFERCRALTTGRTTDTHRVRIQGQFDDPDRATVIRRVVNNYYGSFSARFMPDYIDKNWDRLTNGTRDELMIYLWVNNSGGGVADLVSGKIREAVAVWDRIHQGIE